MLCSSLPPFCGTAVQGYETSESQNQVSHVQSGLHSLQSGGSKYQVFCTFRFEFFLFLLLFVPRHTPGFFFLRSFWLDDEFSTIQSPWNDAPSEVPANRFSPWSLPRKGDCALPARGQPAHHTVTWPLSCQRIGAKRVEYVTRPFSFFYPCRGHSQLLTRVFFSSFPSIINPPPFTAMRRYLRLRPHFFFVALL